METRKFAWQKGVTHALRNKETGKDYRCVGVAIENSTMCII